jgi:hypothetical protein
MWKRTAVVPLQLKNKEKRSDVKYRFEKLWMISTRNDPILY